MRKGNKTPDYIKKAVANYKKDKKQVSIIFTAQQWEDLEKIGISSGADIKRYLLEKIKSL